MATLAPGILLKLLDAMPAGAAKPVGEHRTALLQVTDIVPADLDEKDLWPRHGFYVKLSDSSHSIYASLPFEQEDLVLSNKLQLGQFIQIERLEQGSPVPVIRGAKPIPGRHPLVGTPEPIVRTRSKTNAGSIDGVRRGSWGQEQGIAKQGVTPVSSSPVVERTPMKQPQRCSTVVGGFASPVSSSSRGGGELLKEVSRSCIVGSSKFPRSKSVSRIPRSPFSIDKKNHPSTPPRTRGGGETPLATHIEEAKEIAPTPLLAATIHQSISESTNKSFTTQHNNNNRIPLPGKLGTLGKDVMQQRDEVQKVALQALRDASATESLVRMLKKFSDFSTTSRADTPTSCFEQFTAFHQEISQAISDMEKIQSATSIATKIEEEEHEEQQRFSSTILHEIAHNSNTTTNSNSTKRRVLAVLSKSMSLTPDSKRQQQFKQNHHPAQKSSEENNHQSVLANSIKMAKQIQLEAGNWFMEFVEKALESGLKKQRCPQAVLLKVINWIEVEQCDGNKRNGVHPRAGNIARKLRIKMKNP